MQLAMKAGSDSSTAIVERPIGRLSWLLFAALLLHVFEELPAFPEWATAHFGTTSRTFYVIAHIPILALTAWFSYRASGLNPPRWSIWWMAATTIALTVNVFFHLSTAIAFREISPGMFTAVFIFIPVSIILLPRAFAFMDRPSAVLASATGVGISILFTWSLLLKMPVIW